MRRRERPLNQEQRTTRGTATTSPTPIRLLAAAALAALALHAAAAAPVRAQGGAAGGAAANRPPFLISADTLTYDREAGAVTARGDVDISSGERQLLADEARYDERTGRLFARGNVVLIEPSGDALFGDEVEVSGDLREGFVRSVGVLLKDGSRIASATGNRRGGNVVELDRAVYSPCPLCEDGSGRALWQIKARRVTYDEVAQTVGYRDARLELFGLPIGYTPYFRHPAPGVERQSGFLAPTFGSSTETGLLLELPYHYVINPSTDVTFSPIFTQTAGTVLGGEFRRQHRDGYTQLAGSGTYGAYDESDIESERDAQFRGHVVGYGDYGVTERSRAGFETFLASDKTYLDRYGIDDDDILENRVYLEGNDARDFWSLNGYYFQSLRLFDDQDQIPVALPLAEWRRASAPMAWGSTWTLDSSALALTRADGLDTRRLSTTAAWNLPGIGPIGDLYRFTLSLRGDVYQTEGDPETFSAEGGTDETGRVVPRATLDWSWPLAGFGGGWAHEVEPVVSVNISPPGGNPDEIPNEDSQDFEFDETNLFEPNPFPGLDRVAGGPRVAYGLRFSSFGPRATEVGGVVGQSYSLDDGDEFPEDSGLNDNLSDYVGAFYLRPSPLLDLSYRFRLGRENLDVRRSDLLAVAGPAFFRVNVGYVNLDSEPETFQDEDQFGFGSREEIVLGARAQLTERVAVGAQTRRDLDTDRTVANQFGLIYTHPCLVLAVGYEERFTPDARLGDEATLLIRVSFQNLGEIKTGAGLFGGS